MQKSRKVLITGGLGYIGSHVAAQLVEHGFDVCIVDDMSNAVDHAHSQLEKLCGRDIALDIVSVTDYVALEKAFERQKPDEVIHCAGLKSISDSWKNPLEYYRVNVTGTVNVLRAMDHIGCETIIFSSSATVYGSPDYLPVDENHSIGAVNPYGRSKHMAEELIIDWQRAQETNAGTGLAVILRYYNPVGAHDSLLIGENPRGVANNLFPVICEVVNGHRDTLDIFGDDYPTQDGSGERDYIHVMDLSLAHVKCLGSFTKPRHVVLNIGTGVSTSVTEIIRMFETEKQTTLPTRVMPRRDGDVAIILADNDKSMKALGQYVFHDLQSAIASSLAFASLPSGS
jgi:UDP-glucose 4-epimerase